MCVRERDKERERQTDRQREGEKERDRDKETERDRQRQRDRKRWRKRDKHDPNLPAKSPLCLQACLSPSAKSSISMWLSTAFHPPALVSVLPTLKKIMKVLFRYPTLADSSVAIETRVTY